LAGASACPSARRPAAADERHRGRRDLAALKRELQLVDRLRGRAEPVGTMDGELMTELLDQDRLCLHFGQEARREGPQVIGIVGSAAASSSMG
jgi:hypothetical protein